jgi:hypothetical protein
MERQFIPSNKWKGRTTLHRLDGPAVEGRDNVFAPWWYCGIATPDEEKFWDPEWRKQQELQLTTAQTLILLDQLAELEHLNSID